MNNPLYDALFGQHIGKQTPFLRLTDGSTVSHNAFLQEAARFAHVLVKSGLEPGDRLAVHIEKTPQALAVYAACVQAGIIFLPLNTAYTPAEVSYFVEDAGAKMMLCDQNNLAGLQPIADQHAAKLETLNLDGSGSFLNLANKAPDQFETVSRCIDDLAALLYTSGTTGRSKGAMLSQGNLLSNAQTLTDYWQFTSGDVLLHALPIFHTHGLFVATNVALLSGSSILFLAKFDTDAIIDALPHSTVLMGVPTFYTRLLSDNRFTQELTSKMRLFISGSAPLLAETHVQFEERTGHLILERYGMTETNMNTSNPYDGGRRAGTVGLALPGVEIKVTDPNTGETLPDGRIGVLEVRGPNVFQGYWEMPEKTAEELRENGFFITGDLGRIDDQGYVEIVGRNKDLIISGGYNIYPKEVELVLDEHPDVLESAVVGVPHPDFGESVVAILVAQVGVEPNLKQIQSSLEVSLAKFKQPKMLVVLGELPRNTMGKVQKNLLRDQYANLFVKE
jgi:malonyl-CoA/methylmalonyl-CoA synthetase